MLASFWIYTDGATDGVSPPHLVDDCPITTIIGLLVADEFGRPRSPLVRFQELEELAQVWAIAHSPVGRRL